MPGGGRRRRPFALGASGVVLLLVFLCAAWTWSAFSGTTANPGNSATAGTVALTDNDAGSASFTLSDVAPGDTDTSCIQVTYTGSLPALVRLYGTTTGTGLDPYLTLEVTRGTGAGTFDDCTGCVADATNYIGAGAPSPTTGVPGSPTPAPPACPRPGPAARRTSTGCG